MTASSPRSRDDSVGDAVAGRPATGGPAAARLESWRYLSYVLRRIAQAVPLVVGVVCVNFIIIHAAPGDPITALIGEAPATPEYIEQLRRDFGLDRPLAEQLLTYLGKILTFDLGYSLRFRQPVLLLIAERIPATLLLIGTALVVSSILGIVLGTIAARRSYGVVDNAATFVALAGYSMPAFWLGQLLLLAFALHLPIFPAQGMTSVRAPAEGWGLVLDVLHHLALPAITYSIYNLTLIFRLTRVKMIDTLAQDFILLARAKGVPERGVVYRHALRNAMLPIITVIGYNVGFMLAGSVMIETVYAWPGVGRLMFEAINARDYPVLLGMLTVVSFFVVIVNVVTDICYALVDPRIVYR